MVYTKFSKKKAVLENKNPVLTKTENQIKCYSNRYPPRRHFFVELTLVCRSFTNRVPTKISEIKSREKMTKI